VRRPALGLHGGYCAGPSAAAVGTHLQGRRVTGRHGAPTGAATRSAAPSRGRTRPFPAWSSSWGWYIPASARSAAFPTRPASSRATPRLLRGAGQLPGGFVPTSSMPRAAVAPAAASATAISTQAGARRVRGGVPGCAPAQGPGHRERPGGRQQRRRRGAGDRWAGEPWMRGDPRERGAASEITTGGHRHRGGGISTPGRSRTAG